jgi:hypothetical protein
LQRAVVQHGRDGRPARLVRARRLGRHAVASVCAMVSWPCGPSRSSPR